MENEISILGHLGITDNNSELPETGKPNDKISYTVAQNIEVKPTGILPITGEQRQGSACLLIVLCLILILALLLDYHQIIRHKMNYIFGKSTKN